MLGAAVAGVLALGSLPAVAVAQSAHPLRPPARVIRLDRRSAGLASHSASSADHAALDAYRGYLLALTADETASAGRDQLIADGVANTCAGALDGLSGASSGQLSRKALTAFSEEVDADLDLAYMGPTQDAVNRLSDALRRISWPTAAQARTSRRLIGSERALLGVSQPNLCRDAATLDAAPLSEPTATVHFLRHYKAAAGSLHATLSAFQRLLSQYETSSDAKLVNQIDALVSSFSAQSASTEESAATAVLSELGVGSGD